MKNYITKLGMLAALAVGGRGALAQTAPTNTTAKMLNRLFTSKMWQIRRS
jgi:hypothetical protein